MYKTKRELCCLQHAARLEQPAHLQKLDALLLQTLPGRMHVR